MSRPVKWIPPYSIYADNFKASFDMIFSSPAVSHGYSGLTFAWVVTPGSGHNYNNGLGLTGLTGYAVEFDTSKGDTDPNDNHMAVVSSVYDVNVHQPNHLVINTNIPELDKSRRHVDMSFSSGEIVVSMDGVEYLNYTIEGYTPYDAYFGFTASTGSGPYINIHYIDNFTIDPFEPVPEPSTMLLFSFGLIGLVVTVIHRNKNSENYK